MIELFLQTVMDGGIVISCMVAILVGMVVYPAALFIAWVRQYRTDRQTFVNERDYIKEAHEI